MGGDLCESFQLLIVEQRIFFLLIFLRHRRCEMIVKLLMSANYFNIRMRF